MIFNDLKTWDCLFVLVLFKYYVYLIMLQLDVVIIREPFEHNFPSNSLIILVILYFACIFLSILCDNCVYIVFTAVLMGSGEILVRNSFWVCM